MRSILILLLVLSGMTSNVYSAELIQIAGAGNVGCGVWIADKNANNRRLLDGQTWVLGYLSGKAVTAGKDILRNTPDESLFLWIDNYCQSNPLSNIADASSALYFELIRQKGL